MMKSNEAINESITNALNSIDDVKRASPKAYLLTRINSRLQRSKESGWEKVIGFIARPVVAISGLSLLILVNILAVVTTPAGEMNNNLEQSANLTSDVFPNTFATIYDNDNP